MQNTSDKANQVLDSNRPLLKRVAQGAFWVFTLRVIQQVFNLVRLVVLARILAPSDFGVLGIALLAMSTLEIFSQTGFQAALVRKKETILNYLDTVWVVSVIRGIILFAILFVSASYVALFFESNGTAPIIQLIGVSMLFKGFTNIGIVYFQKELDFRKQFIYQFSGMLIDFIVSISAAIIFQNVWALVYGLLAGDIVRLIMSYLIHPFRPKFTFDWDQFKDLFGFGKWVLGSSIISFLIKSGDDILVGKVLSLTALGFYQLAYKISNIPATEITRVISRVTFPAYSKLQDNLPRLKDAYLKVLQLTTFFSFPISGLIFALAPDFTFIFLGEKWMPMVPAMQALVVWGLIRSVGATTGPIFLAVGRPDLATKLQFVKLILFAIIVYPFTVTWNILGTSLAVVLVSLVVNPIMNYLVVRTVKCRYSEFVKIIIIPLLATLVMLGSYYCLKSFLLKGISVFTFSAQALIGTAVYLIFIYITDVPLNYGIKAILKKQFTSIRGDNQ